MEYNLKRDGFLAVSKRFIAAGLIWHIGAAFLINLLLLALPLLMLQVYDRIIPFRSYNTLTWLTFGVLIALSLELILTNARDKVLKAVALKQTNTDDVFAFDCTMRTGVDKFKNHGPATYLKYFTQLARTQNNSANQLAVMLPDIVFVAVFLIVLTAIGGRLVLVPLACGFLMAILVAKSKKQLKTLENHFHNSDTQLLKMFIRNLTTLFSAKVSGQLHARKDLVEQHQTFQSQSYHMATLAKLSLDANLTTLNQLSFVASVFVGSIMVVSGQLSVGALSAATLLSTRAMQPLSKTLQLWKAKSVQSREHVHRLLKNNVRPRSVTPLPRPCGTILLKDVTVVGPMGKLLRKVNFAQNACTSVCLDTDANELSRLFLHIIAGLRLPDEGIAIVDGFSPALRNLGSASAHISYLGEQRAIFSGSVFENMVGFSDDESRHERAIDYAKQFGLDAYIRKLPDGYQTHLNDVNADALPPGMKQRVALIRALSIDAKLLLLDRPEHDLDAAGCEQLCRILVDEKKTRTLTYSTANPSLKNLADFRYQFENGRLIQTEQRQKQLSLRRA